MMPEDENEAETDENLEGENGAEGEEGEEEEGGSKKMLFIIIGVLILLLAGGGAGAYFTGMLDGLLGKEVAEEHAEDEHGGDPHADPHGKAHGTTAEDEYGEDYGYSSSESDDAHGTTAAKDAHAPAADDGHGAPADDGHGDGGGGGLFVTVPAMLVNLNTDDDTPRYLRLSVQIELKSPADYGAVEAVLPRVVDQFQTYLRELRVKDLRGSAGIYRLQMELLWRVNQAAKPVRVKDVLFQEILIQ